MKDYLGGGVVFSTQVVVITDILQGVLSCDIVNGLVFFDGRGIVPNQSHFLVELVKQKSHQHRMPEIVFAFSSKVCEPRQIDEAVTLCHLNSLIL